MRVFSFKSYLPFVCSSKPSIIENTPCSVEFENGQHVSPSPVTNVLEEELPDEKNDESSEVVKDVEKVEQTEAVKDVNDVEKVEQTEVVKDGNDVEKVVVQLKSILRKPSESGEAVMGKGGVKWMDRVGKELVETREFECSESGYPEEYGSVPCLCVIQ